jgi:hypothetical protein
MKRIFKVIDAKSKFSATSCIQALDEEKVWQVTVQPETRTLACNRAQWPILNAIADQLLWPVNGAMTKLTGEEFKHILTAAYRNETARVAQGLDGGMVLIGHRTREFKREEWGEWMAFLEFVAADRGVKIPMPKNQAAMYE